MGQYLFGCITPDRLHKRQNGQRFNDGDKFYTLTAQDKHGILIDGYIRKLTPIECERLQTLPDRYTECEGVTDAQRYKCLGNGWTVDVIAHIFKGMIIPEVHEETLDPLETIKISQALRSEVEKVEFLKKYKPDGISDIDYTIIAVLKEALEKRTQDNG